MINLIASISLEKETITENEEIDTLTVSLNYPHSKPVVIPLNISGTATLDTDFSIINYDKNIGVGVDYLGEDGNNYEAP